MNAARKLTLAVLSAASLAAAHASEAPAGSKASANGIDEVIVRARRDSYPELDLATLAVRNLHLEESIASILVASLGRR